jgi:hypothetical protein
MSPPVMAPAMAKVPASIRSGIVRWLTPCSAETPRIVIVCVPAPSIFPPIRLRSAARSVTSGSQAAFSRTVVPSASVAAIIRFSVPVTVWMSKAMRAPVRRAASASTYPWSSRMVAPSFSSPIRWRLMGRGPMAQPPGSETRARPYRATKGPRTTTAARIVFTRS